MKKLIMLYFLVFVTTQLSAQKTKNEPKSKNTQKPNEFNEVQEMGSSRRYSLRDDYIWGVNTAKSTDHKAMDISLLSPLRYGISHSLELQSNVLLSVLAPNLFLKYNFYRKKIYLASRHGMYSSTPALNFAEKKKWLISNEPDPKIPINLVLRNEFIVSYPIIDKHNCNTNQPYIVLSGIIGLDYGKNITTSSSITSLTKPWLEPRLATLSGNGFNTRGTLRVDYIYMPFKVEAEVIGVNDDFTKRFALENRVTGKYFPYQNLSLSLGWSLSYASFSTSPQIGIIPFLDVTLYLGTRQNRMKGLWKEKMY